MGMFGDIDIEDIATELERGRYPLVVDQIAGPHKNTGEENDGPKEQEFYTVTLMIDYTHEDFGGTRLERIFLNVYPTLTKAILAEYSEENQARVRNNMRYFRAFNEACGVTVAEMQDKKYNFEDLKGTLLWGDCFTDKNGSFRVAARSLALRVPGDDGRVVTAEDLAIFNE